MAGQLMVITSRYYGYNVQMKNLVNLIVYIILYNIILTSHNIYFTSYISVTLLTETETIFELFIIKYIFKYPVFSYSRSPGYGVSEIFPSQH